MGIKHLLVDLDGVIRHWPDHDEAIEKKNGLPVNSIRPLAFSNKLLLPAIRGEVLDAVWRRSVETGLAQAFPNSQAENAVMEWSESPGCIDDKVLSLFVSCADVELSLVTNATSRLKKDLLALGIYDSFQGIFNSSETGFVKPEAQFFSCVLDQLGASPSEVVFIDDSAENIHAAQQSGMNAHQFVGIINLEKFLANALRTQSG